MVERLAAPMKVLLIMTLVCLAVTLTGALFWARADSMGSDIAAGLITIFFGFTTLFIAGGMIARAMIDHRAKLK